MDLGVVATVFAVILLAELPDKSMIATLVMGSRSNPLLVWIGASSAFLFHTVLAVIGGCAVGAAAAGLIALVVGRTGDPAIVVTATMPWPHMVL